MVADRTQPSKFTSVTAKPLSAVDIPAGRQEGVKLHVLRSRLLTEPFAEVTSRCAYFGDHFCGGEVRVCVHRQRYFSGGQRRHSEETCTTPW